MALTPLTMWQADARNGPIGAAATTSSATGSCTKAALTVDQMRDELIKLLRLEGK